MSKNTNNNKVGLNTATPQTTLDVKGDGFIVSQKTKLTTEDPNNRPYNMPLSNITYTDAAGILYDPSGSTAPYPSGLINTTTTINLSAPNIIGIKLTFEVFDTEANGDSVIIMNSTGTTIVKYSGNTLPPDFYFNGSVMQIKFKTNGNSVVGQGFKIIWQKVDSDGTSTPIDGISGNSAYFDATKGAFRSGNLGQYSTETIGNNSVAMGFANRASSDNAIAMGNSNIASNSDSIAMGSLSKATGISSTAIGYNARATANYSMAFGVNNLSSGNNSITIGSANNATNSNATAFGIGTIASGSSSTAMGVSSTASGSNSTSMGQQTIASGIYSTAMGLFSVASGYSSTATGSSSRAVGDFSIATGYRSNASGYMSTATGYSTTASGSYSTAMNYNTYATGNSSIATGYYSIASGDYSNASGIYTNASTTASFASGDYSISGGHASTSMGSYTNASGYASIALGNRTNASGYNSTAMGTNSIASGFSSTAMGYNTYATGNNSTAMGSNAYAFNEGSFVIGDSPNSSNTLFSPNFNTFSSRFRSGYYLYTSATLGTGAILFGGSNSWSTISDSTKKENFQTIDGENILKKIAKMRTVTWNYKGQDPKTFRHYGLMAQEFFSAFGRDKLGTIGNDTTIASADFDGVSITAIKALEKRTQDLQIENESLKNRLNNLEKANTEMVSIKAEMEELKSFLLPEKEKIKVKVVSDK